jgi:putative hydrolase of the HAD superfamily
MRRAVVFDFFGTLTDPGNEHRRRAVYDAIAAVLGIASGRFWEAVTGSFTERATGVLGDTPSTLREMAARCGTTPSAHVLDEAVTTHRTGATALHEPRPGALDVLTTLRARGFRIAVLSDCSSELCEAWDELPYAELVDATVLSWRVGYRKPDPRGYRAAAEALGVAPEECWFVGDGGSRELHGAAGAGMTPVLVANTAHPDHARYRDDPDAFVPDHVVDDLDAVPDLLGWPSQTAADEGDLEHRPYAHTPGVKGPHD